MGRADVYGGEVQAADGEGVAAFRGVEWEGSGEVAIGCEGAYSSAVARALGVGGGEKRMVTILGKEGFG